MSNKKDFLDGMGSVFDIKGDRHFNEFKNYPSPNGVIRNVWHNTGCYINNAVHSFEEKKGKKQSVVRKECEFSKY